MIVAHEGSVCPICGSYSATVKGIGPLNSSFHITCPTCGLVILPDHGVHINTSRLASYLYYANMDYEGKSGHVFAYDDDGSLKDKYKDDPKFHIFTDEVINMWYPKTFSRKIDLIVLALAHLSKNYGYIIQLTEEEWLSLLFIENEEVGKANISSEMGRYSQQLEYIVNYLKQIGYITHGKTNFISALTLNCILQPNGLQRVDELQRSMSSNKNCFIAMSFNKDMHNIREAICLAIKRTGYEVRIMDAIEHNRQIVPEMLYEIRNARFVIAELTGHNNGAYYEAGYALGLGKEVIHICKADELQNTLHFDVKQVNTVTWTNEEELTDKLIKRIEATIS